MKKLITTSLFILFLVCGLNAQTDIKLPTFEGKDVTVRLIENPYPTIRLNVQVSDGVIGTYNVELSGTAKEPVDVTKALSTTISQLRTQGYKLTTSNSGSSGYNGNASGISYYIFQKD